MAKHRIQRSGLVIVSYQSLQSLPLLVGHLPSRPLRLDAKDYHKPIITNLLGEGKLQQADLPAGRQYLHRLMVNYIRHNNINVGYPKDQWYQGLLEEATERVGFHDAYRAINIRVLDAIKEAFPVLADECETQKYEQHYLVEPEDIFRKFSTTGEW